MISENLPPSLPFPGVDDLDRPGAVNPYIDPMERVNRAHMIWEEGLHELAQAAAANVVQVESVEPTQPLGQVIIHADRAVDIIEQQQTISTAPAETSEAA